MTKTKHNIHKHELIGSDVQIAESTDRSFIGLKGRIVDETKNTFKINIKGREKTLPKKGTVLTLTIDGRKVRLNATDLRFRPEDRIKKAKRGAVA